MKLPIAFALLVSVVIIGGATLIRFVPSADEKAALELIAVEQEREEEAYYDVFVEKASATPTATTTTISTPLTKTQVVSQQLLSDFMDLASTGQIDEDNFDDFVTQYVNYVPNLSTYNQIGASDIRSVDNTKANFQSYVLRVEEIEKERQKSVGSISMNSNREGGLDGDSLRSIETAARAYESAATKLKSVLVPNALVVMHTKLINNFLSTTSGLRSIINDSDKDPALSFSGMIIVSSNVKEEVNIYNEITDILVENNVE